VARLRILAIAESAAGAGVLGAGLGGCERLHVLGVIVADSCTQFVGLGERPDVALVEVERADGGGLACIGGLAALAIPVVAVVADMARAAEAWDAGARGLVRSGTTEPWQALIEVVAGGGMGMDQDQVATIFFRDAETEAVMRSLTPRELEVLALVADGHTNAEIARVLAVTPSTVRYHLSTILEKLAVRDRTAAVAYALQLGALRGWRRSGNRR
jgi:DNA-binding NarL/FixJ family response regulator